MEDVGVARPDAFFNHHGFQFQWRVLLCPHIEQLLFAPATTANKHRLSSQRSPHDHVIELGNFRVLETFLNAPSIFL